MGLELSGDHWLLVDWTEQVPIVVELLVLWVKGRDNGESVKTEGISASEVDLKGKRVNLLFTVVVFVSVVLAVVVVAGVVVAAAVIFVVVLVVAVAASVVVACVVLVGVVVAGVVVIVVVACVVFIVVAVVVVIWPIEVVYCCLQNTISAPSDNFRYIVRSYVVFCSSSSSNIVFVLLTAL